MKSTMDIMVEDFNIEEDRCKVDKQALKSHVQ